MGKLNVLKHFINQSKLLTFIYKKVKYIGIKYFYNYTLTKKFKDACGYELNLAEPKGFCEKIQWIKVNCHEKLMTICADKYMVRKFVTDKIGNKYLTKVYGVYSDANEIDFEKLPQRFVLKSNHASGQIIIVEDKEKINKAKIIKICNSWLKENYYYITGEWVYKDIQPKILCEELLGSNMIDYKFYCFNGKSEFLYVSKGFAYGHDSTYMNFLNLNWEKTPFQRNDYNSFNIIPPKPKYFREMINISERLAGNFNFARIDLYYIENRGIIFSEITFYPSGGFAPFYPLKYEYEIGNLLNIKL